MKQWVAAVLMGVVAAVALGETAPRVLVGEVACGRLDGGSLGPWDYRDPTHSDMLRTVNVNHFNSDVRELRRGQTGYDALPDLDFILRHFPNHPGALQVTARYFLQGGKPGKFLAADCYFDRAIRGYPDDVAVRQIFSMYLSRTDRMSEAIDQLEIAIGLLKESSMELHYNLGLLYADVGDFEKANENARIAYAMGHPLPGLREKLKRLGQWRIASPVGSVEPNEAAQ